MFDYFYICVLGVALALYWTEKVRNMMFMNMNTNNIDSKQSISPIPIHIDSGDLGIRLFLSNFRMACQT